MLGMRVLSFSVFVLTGGIAFAERVLPPAGSDDAKRPYEMVWANRRAETRPVADPLVSGDGWRTLTVRAEARVSTGCDRLVFGDGALRLDYRATGTNPVVRIVRETPLALPAFDTFSVWIYGNNFYGNPVPSTEVGAEFTDAEGRPFGLAITTVIHREWCQFVIKVPEGLRARTKAGGCRLLGLAVKGGDNPDFARLDFTSVCAFVETFGPLSFAPRARRGVQVFADQPQGVNTGAGRLPFPTVGTTVVPPVERADPELEFRFPKEPGAWDDLAFRIRGGAWVPLALGGGVWPRSAAGRAEARFRRMGNSVVADVVVRGGDVEELRFGDIGVATNAPAFPVPFYRWGLNEQWTERPHVVAAQLPTGTRFVSAVLDWTQSNASEPYMPRGGGPGVASFGGAKYLRKTDGTRNDVYERFVWTVSPRFEETLPVIPNPVSPWRHVTGRTCWFANPSQPDRATNVATWVAHRRKGIRRMTVTDHETCWRDGMESFTFRTNSAPRKGGDANLRDYARRMTKEFAFRYGPYNNFTDLCPVNEHWHPDHVLRRPDGSLCETWSRCWSPKPLYGLEMCEKLTPVIASSFDFNTAYCDVHTAVPPWGRTDYDARVPGAGTFAQTFYAYGEILLIQKRCWKGPVSSEGGNHWFYAGLSDQNYGQDGGYALDKHPWIVDFDLLRMHPHGSDHGMGYAYMLWGTPAWVPKDVWRLLDVWHPATLAFGHAAFLLPQHPSYAYYMTLAIASRYSQENVRSIRYADAEGRRYTTSEAVLNGVYRDNRIVVDYDGGTHVEVNVKEPGSVYATGGDTVVFCGRDRNGAFGSYCRGGREEGYCYVNGRGSRFTCELGSTECELIRLAESDGVEEVIPAANPDGRGDRSAEIGLPYAAGKVTALDETKTELSDTVGFRTDENGWTWLRPQPSHYSYRVRIDQRKNGKD